MDTRSLCYEGFTLDASRAADGMRGVRDVYAGSTTTRTTYVRVGGSVISEYTMSSGTTTHFMRRKHYVYGPLGLLATLTKCVYGCEADEVEDEDTTRYYEYDHLGTIRAITNSSGALESTFDYEPFGLELIGETESDADTASNTHKFTGHERDKEAGEDYMKARMYTLGTARFPQIDPMFGGAGNPQNWNAYIYVGNSPVGASDPTGMRTDHEKADTWGMGIHGEYAGGGSFGPAPTEKAAITQASNPTSGGVASGSITPNNPPGNPITGSANTIPSVAGAGTVAGNASGTGQGGSAPPAPAGTPGSSYYGPPAPAPITPVTIVGEPNSVSPEDYFMNYAAYSGPVPDDVQFFAGATAWFAQAGGAGHELHEEMTKIAMEGQCGGPGANKVNEIVGHWILGSNDQATKPDQNVYVSGSGTENNVFGSAGRFGQTRGSTCGIPFKQVIKNENDIIVGTFYITFMFDANAQRGSHNMMLGTVIRSLSPPPLPVYGPPSH